MLGFAGPGGEGSPLTTNPAHSPARNCCSPIANGSQIPRNRLLNWADWKPAGVVLEIGVPNAMKKYILDIGRVEADGGGTYHLILQSAFKPKTSLTRSPAVDHHHGVAQGGQSVEPEVFNTFKGVID